MLEKNLFLVQIRKSIRENYILYKIMLKRQIHINERRKEFYPYYNV